MVGIIGGHACTTFSLTKNAIAARQRLRRSPPGEQVSLHFPGCRLAGDTARAATSDEVHDLRHEATALKEVVADLTLENRLLKKSVTADGEDGA